MTLPELRCNMRPCKLGCFHPRRSYRYSSPSIMNPQISPKHSESGSFVLSTWYCILGSFVLDILKFTGWTMTIDCISSWYEVIWYWFLSKESRGPLWVEAGKLSRKYFYFIQSHCGPFNSITCFNFPIITRKFQEFISKNMLTLRFWLHWSSCFNLLHPIA